MRREFNTILYLRDPNVEALPLQGLLKDKNPDYEICNVSLEDKFIPMLKEVQARVILADLSSDSSSKVRKALKKAMKVDKSIPFVLITYVRGKLGKFEAHKKIAKYTFPLWLYVALSGVVVYLMIAPYYTH